MAKKKRRKASKGKTKGESKYEWLVKKGQEFSKDLIAKVTKEEKLFYSILKELGYKFEFQVPIITNKKHLYIVDFLLTDFNIFCELDGAQHSTPLGIKKDNLRSRRLIKEGYYPIRLTNLQAKVFTKEQINQVILSKVSMLKFVNNSKPANK